MSIFVCVKGRIRIIHFKNIGILSMGKKVPLKKAMGRMKKLE